MNIFGYFSLIIVLSHLPTFLGSDLFYKRYSRGLKCPSIGIPKARIRLRSRGRAARVSCIQDYQLLGDRYIICEQGEWAEPLPVCIKGGCPWLKTLVPNAEISLSYLGGLANIACLDGYTLSGPSVLICNGFKWNGTIPSCYLNKQSVQKSCDFESAPDDYLCGWKNDVNDNFDWERQSMATPSGFIGTGPEFDHTLGAGLNGHYLYIEATDHNNGDVARLISSHYPPLSENKTNCFTFWYHMYGGHIGSLNVYIGREIVLSESGNHGNRWIKAIIPINSTSPFQIIIEGIRGTGYAGDIAIDDLKLSEGLDCLVGQSNITELTLPGSCSGRCNDNSTTDIDSCYCHEECHLNGTCCADFLQSCGLASQAPYYKEEPNKFRMSTIVVILLSVLTVGAITSIVIYIVRQRKINRNGNCDDDSDVQFLTSDEIINFNWARPSPDRQLYHSPRPERLDCLGLEEK
ncbi:uncharacterized protein LOC142328755 isoform X2 [Lycorma delicatula]|uniref:uncharacterized protein LOC142328755 isoform X2 n=1 Tax=Lycorma delicatula TaxID=130591 RepID=UPI003F514835